MAGMDWFRWHHGSVTDPKFQLVARKTGTRVADVIAVWATLLEEASQSEDRGNPGTLDFEAIDCALGLSDGNAAAIHASLGERGIIDKDGHLTAWDERQPKREREDATSTERSRASRAKKAQEALDSAMQRHATPCNANDSQETPRGEESRQEINLKPLSVVSEECTPIPAGLAGAVCARLKKSGITAVNPSHPKLLELLKAGATGDELGAIADEPNAKKGFAWVLATAEGRRRDAAASGAIPQARASPGRTPTSENFDSRNYGTGGRL